MKKAFTLIELLVVISVIGLLASMVLASLSTARDKGRVAAGKQFFSSLEHVAGDQAAAMWDFDECSGSTTRDRSGSGNSTTFSGVTAFSTDSPWNTIGCSVSFNGTTDWFWIPQPNVQTTPNYFTLAGWMNPDNQYARFIVPNSNGIDQWIGYVPSEARLEVQITEIADVNNRNRLSSAGAVPLNKWTHFAVSFNNRNIKIYINGKLDAEYNETIDIGGWTLPWAIGQRSNAADWYKGKLDNLRVYSTILGASEVQRLYAEGAASHGIAVR